MKVFVLMPFKDDYDDVHHIIKDAAKHVHDQHSVNVECRRADEIAEPGRISDQILAAIRDCDLVIADLTGNNPNVMYELGYAHALEKPAIILNQQVHESPFDVKDFRQITYDRSRLLKDCRPSLIASITAVLADADMGDDTTRASVVSSEIVPQANTDDDGAPSGSFIRPGNALTAALQKSHLKLKHLGSKGDSKALKEEGQAVRRMLDRVTVVGRQNRDDLHNAVGAAGNCAVELEAASINELAESIWRKAIGLFPEHAGLHIQYCNFLINLGRIDEARQEFDRVTEVDANDRRLRRLEMKLALTTGHMPPEFGAAAKEGFEKDPGNPLAAAAYLIYLTETEAPDTEFEKVCDQWAEASGDQIAPQRALADYFASHGDAENRKRARKIYSDQLSVLKGDDRHAVLHNLATLLASDGDEDGAEKHWREAYLMKPGDPTVQATFSQLLARRDRMELALKVASGEVVSEHEFVNT